MCDKYSFVQDKQGNIYNGYGINSHSCICKIHKLNEDKINKYEYDPYKNNCHGGIKGLNLENGGVNRVTATDLDIIAKHLTTLFPINSSWDSFEALKTDENILGLIELSKDKDSDARYAVAGNINTPIAVLIELSKDNYYYVRRSVAENINTPIAVLIELSKDNDSDVKYAVARNINTPIAVLIELSKDNDYHVKYAVARNINTPIAVLIELSKDNYYYVRHAVAGNINTPIAVLIELSKDSDYHVRRAVAENITYINYMKGM